MDTRWKIGRRKLTEAERRFALALIPVKERAVQKQGEEIHGTVVAANARGFQLHGMEKWCNWSKYADEPRTLPAPGHNIWALLDAQGFVREVSILQTGTPRTGKQSKPPTTQAVSPSGNNTVRTVPSNGVFVASQPAMQADRTFRLACLALVVEFQPRFEELLSQHDSLLDIAEAIAAWAEGKEL